MRIPRFAAAFLLMTSLAGLPCLASSAPVITVTADTVYPEGVDWSASQGRFFVGSVRHGTIGTVDSTGHYQEFIHDDSLPSTFGIRVDDARQQLWVTATDLGTSVRSSPKTQGKMAAIGVYSLRDGKKLAAYDLSIADKRTHLANDIALDPQGNAYVSDSLAHAIYRIDTSGKLALFSSSPLFETGEAFGLNGITYHPDGYLLVGAWNSGELFRVNLANPSDVIKVRLPETFKGMDGIALLDPRHLILSVNMGTPRAVELTSDDGWLSAKVAKVQNTASTFPTAVAIVGSKAWVLNSRLDTLIDPKATKVNSFVLETFDQQGTK